MSPAMQGQSLDNGSQWLKALYYGMPGSAKTTSMATMARLGPTVVVDMGEEWIKRALVQHDIPVKNVTRFTPRSYDEIEQVGFEVQSMLNEGINLQGISVDTLSAMEELLVRDAALERINKAKRSLRPRLATSPEAREEYELLSEFRTELSDYGVWTNQALKIVRIFRDQPCHVAFGAHERTDTGRVVPALTEKFRNKLMGSVPLVIYTKARDLGDHTQYVGVTQPVQNVQGKDRYKMLPVVTVNPHMDRLVKVLEGTLDLATDPAQQAYEASLAG